MGIRQLSDVKFKRHHLFELEDFDWFPDVIRSGGTDYLRYFLIRIELYKRTVDVLREALKESGEHRLIDLCSGGGGYVEHVIRQLNTHEPGRYTVMLTDKFPNLAAFEHLKSKNAGKIDYSERSVDAVHVPSDLKGFRVMYSAVHHFKPGQVKDILKNAVEADAPIAFFDGGERGLLPILGMLVVHPLGLALCTPFFRPFRWSRLLLTYLFPVIPLYTLWDGFVSILRMYEPSELLSIAEFLGETGYVWKTGKVRNRFGIRASYFIGYPVKNSVPNRQINS